MPMRTTVRHDDLRHIETWVFDLDNTLYPATAFLFSQIDVRMKVFIAKLLSVDEEEAFRIQKTYYRAHGTTLRGLMLNHDVDPDEFLEFVHDIDHSVLSPDPDLGAAISRLPGRKLIYTNGSLSHAISVLGALGIDSHFEAIFDIRAGDYIPKPDPASYERFFKRHLLEPATAIMFEDSEKNLKPAAEMGMVTVLITHESIQNNGNHSEYCHYMTNDLKGWLKAAISK